MIQKEAEPIDFNGPSGVLEGLVNCPVDQAPRAAAVICHAHPLHGGMMHFKVIFRAAKALQSQGCAVLRFNFRGVGRSAGTHDDGVGEQDDVRAALAEAARRFPDLPLVLGGFSFGSAMATLVAADTERVKACLVLGYPITRLSSTADLARVRQPRLFVQGGADIYGSGEAMRALVATLPEPKRLEVIEGADHFFKDRLEELQTIVSSWAGSAPWSAA